MNALTLGLALFLGDRLPLVTRLLVERLAARTGSPVVPYMIDGDAFTRHAGFFNSSHLSFYVNRPLAKDLATQVFHLHIGGAWRANEHQLGNPRSLCWCEEAWTDLDRRSLSFEVFGERVRQVWGEDPAILEIGLRNWPLESVGIENVATAESLDRLRRLPLSRGGPIPNWSRRSVRACFARSIDNISRPLIS